MLYICGRVSECLPGQFPETRKLFLALVYPFFASFFEPRYVNILHWVHDVKFNSTITITII